MISTRNKKIFIAKDTNL